MSVILHLESVSKHFGEVRALDGLDIEVHDGEFFCLFGPSAAGKTTTLRVIAGLERPDRGTVTFAGADLTRAPVQGRDIAMVFQSFALYPHLSVRENLAYPLREQGVAVSEIARRVGETAELLRIAYTLERKPDTLSGGEQQRLAIGRALVRRPRLLLLDEPLTNLDAKLRHDMRAEFKRLHRELGMTMVFATPDQLEALTMGERIAVLLDGAVVQTGTPDGLYDAPDDRRVAAFIGAPQMNLLEGTAHRTGSGAEVDLAFARVTLQGEAAGQVRDGARVLFGIRPHDLAPVAGGDVPEGHTVFETVVHLTEPLGDVTLVDVDAGERLLKMILGEAEALGFTAGKPLRVAMRNAAAHVFDAESGTRIG